VSFEKDADETEYRTYNRVRADLFSAQSEVRWNGKHRLLAGNWAWSGAKRLKPARSGPVLRGGPEMLNRCVVGICLSPCIALGRITTRLKETRGILAKPSSIAPITVAISTLPIALLPLLPQEGHPLAV
jgi:hypothetical protein